MSRLVQVLVRSILFAGEHLERHPVKSDLCRHQNLQGLIKKFRENWFKFDCRPRQSVLLVQPHSALSAPAMLVKRPGSQFKGVSPKLCQNCDSSTWILSDESRNGAVVVKRYAIISEHSYAIGWCCFHTTSGRYSKLKKGLFRSSQLRECWRKHQACS